MRNKKLHVQVSPLTNTIFCGSVLKCGKLWASNKTDVTWESLWAVALHTEQFGKPVEITNGTDSYKITVERITLKE